LALQKHSVHRLVAELFVGNPNGGNCVNHIDGDYKNNNAENLEWCTQRDNVRHSIKIGTTKNVRKTNSSSKITESEIVDIKSMIKSGVKIKHIAERYDTTTDFIYKVRSGRVWSAIVV
jgi:hypothetical protein